MEIERTLVFNLPKDVHRRSFAEGALWSLGFPRDEIEFVKCRHWADYKDVDELRAAAVEDGFEFFMSGVNEHRWGIAQASFPTKLQAATWSWSWCIALREIVESNKTTALLVDDTMPTINFKQFQLMCSDLPPSSGIQLNTKPMICEYGYPFEQVEYDSAMLGKGFVTANECGLVLSPRMAGIFLDLSERLRPAVVPLSHRERYGTVDSFHVLLPILSHHVHFSTGWTYE